jgi:hypothetical protein
MMKQRNPLLILFVLLLATGSLCAQDRADVFRPEVKVTWLGFDFSNAKFIGDREKLGSESDIRHLLEAWNDLVLTEKDKYDIAGMIGRDAVETSTDVTKDHNQDLDVLQMISNAEKDYLHLSREGVGKVVSKYDYKKNTGIGLMFNIESFSKLNGEASMWVTFVDMKSKQILFTERMTASPKGFGVRNYWAGALYGVMEHVKKKEFEMWRKKYFRA